MIKIEDVSVSKELDASEMSAVHGGVSPAPDPISWILSAAAADKGAYGVISAASQIEPSQGSGSNPNGVCIVAE